MIGERIRGIWVILLQGLKILNFRFKRVIKIGVEWEEGGFLLIMEGMVEKSYFYNKIREILGIETSIF